MESHLAVYVMVIARFAIVATALTAGILMLKFPTVEACLRINGSIALVNPILMTLINAAGISGLAGKAPEYKLILIGLGAGLIIYGTIKKDKKKATPEAIHKAVAPLVVNGNGAALALGERVAVRSMVVARFMIVAVALAGGILMIIFPTVEANLRINAVVTLINPVIYTIINLIGISSMAGKAPLYKLALLLAGAVLILIGTIK